MTKLHQAMATKAASPSDGAGEGHEQARQAALRASVMTLPRADDRQGMAARLRVGDAAGGRWRRHAMADSCTLATGLPGCGPDRVRRGVPS
jgi:hypothetical protein